MKHIGTYMKHALHFIRILVVTTLVLLIALPFVPEWFMIVVYYTAAFMCLTVVVGVPSLWIVLKLYKKKRIFIKPLYWIAVMSILPWSPVMLIWSFILRRVRPVGRLLVMDGKGELHFAPQKHAMKEFGTMNSDDRMTHFGSQLTKYGKRETYVISTYTLLVPKSWVKRVAVGDIKSKKRTILMQWGYLLNYILTSGFWYILSHNMSPILLRLNKYEATISLDKVREEYRKDMEWRKEKVS